MIVFKEISEFIIIHIRMHEELSLTAKACAFTADLSPFYFNIARLVGDDIASACSLPSPQKRTAVDFPSPFLVYSVPGKTRGRY